MQMIPVTDPESAQRAVDILRDGGVILYPTDTLYGLGADALSSVAVDAIYEIKGRNEKKPMHALVSDIDMAARYGEIDERMRAFAERLPKGKATFIVKKRHGLDTGILRGIETFGFRIPDHAFCLEMVRTFGAPVTATSANPSGEVPRLSFGEVIAQLGHRVALVDAAIDAGLLPASPPSSVIDVSCGEVVVIREGCISAADIHRVWNAVGE